MAAAISTTLQIPRITSVSVNSPSLWNSISHRNTAAPPVKVQIATTGVWNRALTYPSLSGATRSNDHAIIDRVEYDTNAGIQNQIQIEKVARMMTASGMLPARMPASTVM